MKRILFVDDEPRILQGIQRMLRVKRSEWSIETAEGGEEGLARLADELFDVVVSDMRMPGMDGAEFLSRVKEQYPSTIRIVLSGYSDLIASFRALLVAHQFAAKPVGADEMIATLERACSLSDLVCDPAVHTAVGSIDQLPEPPGAYQECCRVLNQEGASAASLAEVVERDPSLAAKVLQVANSAFFGMPQRTADIERAVNYLGTDTIRGIVLALETARVSGSAEPVGPVSTESIMEASVLSAQLTRKIRLGSREDREAAYAAALLHDLGLLALLQSQHGRIASFVEKADAEGISLHQAQLLLGDPPQSRVGAYLLGAWALPLQVVEAVRDHNEGSDIEASRALAAAVHLVDRASKAALAEVRGENAFNRVELRRELIEELGGEATFEKLKDLAVEQITGNDARAAA